MIIDIGTEVDESVIRWKHKETDEWQKADIDELIDAYESIVRCKDCEKHGMSNCYMWGNVTTDDDMWCCDGVAKMKGGAE